MAHGKPDWNLTTGEATTFQLLDVGESAARLGSIVTFDRRGDLVFLDDFEDNLSKWDVTLSGTGASAALSTVRARNGASSLLLTAGSNAAFFAQIFHRQSMIGAGRIAMETSFELASTIGNLLLELRRSDGANVGIAAVRWRDTENDLQYRNSVGTFITFATDVNLLAIGTLFHTAKLLMDIDEGEYVRLLLDATEYSLAGIAFQSESSTASPHARLLIQLTGRSGSNDLTYVDDVIFTQNEP